MAKYQLLPPLSPGEYEALREDIAVAGVLVPIDVDEHGDILDGHHRKQACEELGIECPTRVVEGIPDFAKADYALTVNLARRHLDQKQRRQLVANSVKEAPQLSDRQHARRCGVSPTTVATVRKELEDEDLVSKLDTRTDRRGREQPASKPSAPEPADPAGDGRRIEDPTNEEPGPVVPPVSSPPSEVPWADRPDGDAAGDEESRDDSGPADEQPRTGAGVSPPAAAPPLVDTPVGPMPADFAKKLDALVPDPNPHREWQKRFLDSVFAAAKAMRGYSGADIAEKADDQLRAEFANFVGDMDSLLHETSQAQRAAAADNVRPLRRVQ